MNITKSSSIETTGSVLIDGHTFSMTGAFATFYQTLALQTDSVIPQHIYKRNFTELELDGRLITSTYIQGSVIFKSSTGTQNCPVELRRIAGK